MVYGWLIIGKYNFYAKNAKKTPKSRLCDVRMTSRPHFSKKFLFSEILSENFQHDRVGHIFATCDYMGQKPQKHAFLAILPYPPIYTYLKW